MPVPSITLCTSKHGRICRGMKFREHSVVRVGPSNRVAAEGEIEDRRMAGEAGTAAQDLRKGQIVGPDKRQPVVKSREFLLELYTPESGERS